MRKTLFTVGVAVCLAGGIAVIAAQHREGIRYLSEIGRESHVPVPAFGVRLACVGR